MSGPPVHSNFVTGILSDLDFAAGFLRALLPQSILELIELRSLTLEESSFVDVDMREARSDLLFSVKGIHGQSLLLYILFEHKSHPDPGTLQQLLKYLYLIHIQRDRTLPVVPIVLYHGREEWNIPTSLLDSFELDVKQRTALNAHVLDFRYILIDVKNLDIDGLKANLEQRAFLDILRAIWSFHDLNEVGDYLVRFRDLFYRKSSLEFLEKLLVYIFRVQDIEPERFRKLVAARISEEKEELIMSTAEKLHQQGKLEGKLEDARNLIENGVSLEIILKSTGLTREQLVKAGIIPA